MNCNWKVTKITAVYGWEIVKKLILGEQADPHIYGEKESSIF